MPTTEECIELFSYTTHTWTSVNGINGCLLTSKSNGNTIFLPAAGTRIDLSTESPKGARSMNVDKIASTIEF